MKLFLVLCLFSIQALAQNPKALQLREELHRRIREHLINGAGTNDEIFKDMDALFNDVMVDMSDMQVGAVETRWEKSKDGRTLLIQPKNPNQKLEIDVKDQLINIKGSRELKDQNTTSISNFSQSFSVPIDCDSSKVKTLSKEGKILMVFPFKASK